MNRKYSFKEKLLTALQSLTGTKDKADKAKCSNVVYEGYISGYQYHKAPEVEHLFASGTTFSLKHEPENPFDDDAVALYFDNARIGFIPPHSNVEIARMMARGTPLKARIARFEPNSDPWERVYVEVLNDMESQAVA